MARFWQWCIVFFLLGLVAFAVGGETHGGAVFWGIIIAFVALAVGIAVFPRRKLSDEDRDKLVDEWLDRQHER
jgi:hypothetical protein